MEQVEYLLVVDLEKGAVNGHIWGRFCEYIGY